MKCVSPHLTPCNSVAHEASNCIYIRFGRSHCQRFYCSKFDNLNLISRFKSKAMRISRLLKDSPRTPLEKTGDWIEYVLRHDGARHLRAQVFDIPWYQYYLLDVIAFLVAMATLVAMVIKLMCRCLCNVRCRQSSIKTKKE